MRVGLCIDSAPPNLTQPHEGDWGGGGRAETGEHFTQMIF